MWKPAAKQLHKLEEAGLVEVRTRILHSVPIDYTYQYQEVKITRAGRKALAEAPDT